MNGTTAIKKDGSGSGLLDVFVILAAALLYFKTADVLMFFAPPSLSQIIGMDVSWLYGYGTAALVEGTALALHFNRRAKNYTPAKIVMWITLLVSGLCQVYDGHLVTNAIQNMSDPLKLGFTWGVPLIPLFIVALIFWVGRLPEDDEVREWVGARNVLKGKWSRFLDGDAKPVRSSAPLHASAHAPSPAPSPQQLPPEVLNQIEELVRQSIVNGNGSGGGQGSNFP